MEKAAREYTIQEDDHVVFVVEVLVEIQCTNCQKWVHRKGSGLKANMIEVSWSFVCRGCADQRAGVDRTSMNIDVWC